MYRAVKVVLRADLPQPLRLRMHEHIFCNQKDGGTAGVLEPNFDNA